MGRPTAYDYTFSLHDALPILPFIVSGIRLAVDSALLLMDEPFAALDAQTRELMQAELLRIWNAAKKTVLFVTDRKSTSLNSSHLGISYAVFCWKRPSLDQDEP